jgi:hypothetical protein
MKTMLACFLSVATISFASDRAHPCGPNAALRYWMAMAQMQNPEASSALAVQLEKTARGQLPWDAKLTQFVEQNRDALATMHRGSRLEYCDWGLEWELGSETPIAQIPRLRAMSRLNVIYGIHLLHMGKSSEAADAWIAGLAFSRHIAAGTPLLGALTASVSLRDHLRAIELAMTDKKLDGSTMRLIEHAVASLPEDGFDWGECVQIELIVVEALLARAESSEDPLAMLRRDFGDWDAHALASALGLDVDQLNEPDAIRAALSRSRNAVAAMQPRFASAFRLPLGRSTTTIRELEAEARQVPMLAQALPSLIHADHEVRGGVVRARAELLALLRTR